MVHGDDYRSQKFLVWTLQYIADATFLRHMEDDFVPKLTLYYYQGSPQKISNRSNLAYSY